MPCRQGKTAYGHHQGLSPAVPDGHPAEDARDQYGVKGKRGVRPDDRKPRQGRRRETGDSDTRMQVGQAGPSGQGAGGQHLVGSCDHEYAEYSAEKLGKPGEFFRFGMFRKGGAQVANGEDAHRQEPGPVGAPRPGQRKKGDHREHPGQEQKRPGGRGKSQGIAFRLHPESRQARHGNRPESQQE